MSKNEPTQDILSAWGPFLDAFQEQQTTMAKAYFESVQRHLPLPPTVFGDVFIKAGKALLENPSGLLKAQGELLEEINTLWQKMLSTEPEVVSEVTTDKRFHHKAWQTVPYFLFVKEYYLITSRWLQNLISQVEGLDEQARSKIQFYINQLVEAASPTNFPFTNPEVLEEIVKTKGVSLQKGFETLLEDMETGQWMKMTDPSSFELGKTIASTKGDVIFRNDLFELIHYAPLTEHQYAVPLLIIPPWINKYYIFDLSTTNSFVKWMLEQGHNVFIISWVNPSSMHSTKTFEDYLMEGLYQACEIISSLTQSPTLHTMGYCVGGNLLTALGAYLAKTPASFSLKSMTLLATIIDFTKVGDLKVFMDEDHLQCIEKAMEQKGFLDAETMKSIFSLLRPNELVWSFFIKNYLLGQIPPAFDFLYWNSDSTRLPATLHSFILRKFFQKNLLMKPGSITIKGTPLDLRDIKTPALVLATLEDHISPWKSCYPAVHLFGGPTKFILAGSGHVAGVINPPLRNKYCYFTSSHVSENADEWFNESKRSEGSWWTPWNNWVTLLSGEKILPRADYPSLEPAPGSYVKRERGKYDPTSRTPSTVSS